MKRSLLVIAIIFICSMLGLAQNKNAELGTKFTFDFETISPKNPKLKSSTLSIDLPVGEQYYTFILKENNLSGNSGLIKTYDGKTKDRKARIKLSVFSGHIEGIISTKNGYYIFEPVDIEEGIYRIYNMSEIPKDNLECGADEHDFSEIIEKISSEKLRGTHDELFPIGNNLRVFRMAAAATSGMTYQYGSKANAITQIVSIINAVNLIYEEELAISFALISATTNGDIIWSDSGTDPFVVDPVFANAQYSQNGFTAINTSGLLTYDKYDVGHTFHAKEQITGLSSVGGQAGPTPCIDASKARGWTEWTLGSFFGSIVNVFAHEVGHQFSAWHTYNAMGGSSGSPSFCASGWSSAHAVEPGGGSTLMAYGNNCQLPIQQSLTGDNNLSYFHYKSIEAIQTFLSSVSCYTLDPTGNTPPSANAGVDITIPKGTPFWLNGIASDIDGDELSYTWEQNDVATALDKGALGSTNAIGGTSAILSTTAPLFRSEKAFVTDRTFPKLKFILNDQNTPDNLEGEALPQVARTMNFRFTVKDGSAGVNSDEIAVTVANVGPLSVTLPNGGGGGLTANASTTVTWDVNSTNTLAANVDILLSVDGGLTFPYTLVKNTPNDGTETVTIPNVPATTQARVKVVAILNENANFFDISDANFPISSSCESYSSRPCFNGNVTALKGHESLNLNLSAALPVQIQNPLVMSASSGSSKIYVEESSSSVGVCKEYSGSYPVYTGPIRKIRVATSGSYTFTKTSGAYMLTIFDTATPSCVGFITSTAYWGGSGTDTSFSSSMTVYLDACTDYYLLGLSFSNISPTWDIAITGPGDVYTELTAPAGVGYSYIAVSQDDNTIKAVSGTADFTSLEAGNYTIYGISYPSSSNTNDFLSKTLSAIQGTHCVIASAASIKMTVTLYTNITDIEEDNLLLYPSPVGDLVYIKSTHQFVKAEIINYSGQIISTKDIQNSKILLSDLQSGNYIIKLYDKAGKEYSTKLIKK